jgi:hypothetical protein
VVQVVLEPNAKMVQAKNQKSPYKSMVVQVYQLVHPKNRSQKKIIFSLKIFFL